MAEDVRFVLRFLYGFGLGVMGEWFYPVLLALVILILWVIAEWITKHIKKWRNRNPK